MRVVLFWVALVLAELANGQGFRNIAFHIGQENGLPSNTVFRMLEDQNGFIWFGTNAGVSKFDGHEFKNFDRNDGLEDDEIVGLFEDSQGRIWFLGITGKLTFYFEGKIHNAVSDTFLAALNSAGAFLYAYEDRLHRIWFCSQLEVLMLDGTLVKRFSNKTHPQLSFFIEHNDSMWMMDYASASIRLLTETAGEPQPVKYPYGGRGAYFRKASGEVFYISNGRLLGYRGNKEIENRATGIPPYLWYHDLIMQNNHAWVSTSSGLYKLTLDESFVATEALFPKESFNGLLQDGSGNVWISTSKTGIWMIPNNWSKEKLNSSLPSGNWNLIAHLNGNWVFAGTGETNIIVQSASGERKLFNAPSDMQFIQNAGKLLWLACNSHLFLFDPETGKYKEVYAERKGNTIPLGSVKGITSGKDEHIITTNYAVYSLDEISKNSVGRPIVVKRIFTANQRIFSSLRSADGKLWVSDANGIGIADGAKTQRLPSLKLMERVAVSQISMTGKDTLAFATRGLGLVIICKGRLVQQIGKEEGLRDAYCKKLLLLNDLLLIQTQTGISILKKELGNWNVIRNLHASYFGGSLSFYDAASDGQMVWVLTDKGSLVLAVNGPEMKRGQAPALVITDKFSGTGVAAGSDTLIMNYGMPTDIRFQCIALADPEEVHYRYRIAGNSWQALEQPMLSLPLLQPGTYDLEVQARVGWGLWSDRLHFHVVINPLWWQRVSVQMLILMLSGLLIWYVTFLWFRRKRQLSEQRIQLEMRLNDLEQQALLGLMNPHFVFNVMNAIQHFINGNNLKDANYYIAGFAGLIRKNLNLIRANEICLEDEIELLQDYLRFEEMRFGNKASASITVDPNLDLYDTVIPVMMIQPFVENAIWHGILPSAHNATLEVNFRKGALNWLEVMIKDTGVGIPEKHLGNAGLWQGQKDHGISITIERLKLICKKEGLPFFMEFRRAYIVQNKGTCLVMHLPILITA